MDNFRVDVTARARAHFESVMGMLFGRREAVAFAMHPTKGMVLYHATHDHGDVCNADAAEVPVVRLPYAMNLTAACAFVWHWLETADRGPEPDHDGSNKPGWRVYNEAWGHVAGDWRAFVAIQPVWAMYGK